MKIIDQTEGIVIGEDIRWARSIFTRLKGLMFRKSLGPQEGILMYPCNSIHTFFMNFVIDVLFLDGQMKVIKQIENLEAGKVISPVPKARYVLELPGGKLRRFGNLAGHILRIEE